MFEKRHEPLLPTNAFMHRLLQFGGLAFGLTLIWWGVGILGYHFLGNLGWVDSILNSAMILSGMGPVNPLASTAVKLFASVYAITSGVVFVAAMGILFAPTIHRVYHRFHLDVESDTDDETKS